MIDDGGWRSMKLSLKQRKIIWSLLPMSLKKVRYNELKGKMSDLAENDDFVFDRGIFRLFGGGYSQFGQDIFIYKMVMNERKNGFFLDIGGNDPVKINNSYLFELNGWKGLAFEPIKSLAMKWKDARKTECLNMAIGEEEAEVEFTESEDSVLSGIRDSTIKYNDDAKIEQYKVKQRKLGNVLAERNITKVDVMFVDVEGYEMHVLKGIDFDKVDISVICLENNEEGDDRADLEIRRFLIKKGYRLIGRLTIDDLFVKKNFLERIN